MLIFFVEHYEELIICIGSDRYLGIQSSMLPSAGLVEVMALLAHCIQKCTVSLARHTQVRCYSCHFLSPVGIV